jgi:hypothetical protein
MDSSSIMNFLAQMANQIPSLIVYLVGATLTLIFWRRCPRACALTLTASVLLLVMAFAMPTLYFFLGSLQSKLDWTLVEYHRVLSAISFAGNTIHAAAIGLLLAAAFVGRKATR